MPFSLTAATLAPHVYLAAFVNVKQMYRHGSISSAEPPSRMMLGGVTSLLYLRGAHFAISMRATRMSLTRSWPPAPPR